MPEPRTDQRRELFNRMQAIVKATGPFTGFRRSDLMKHDREFILKQWTGEPLLWFPYDSGTHIMRLGGPMIGRQRDEVFAVLDTAVVDFADVHFFIIEGPQFPPREVPGRQIRDEVMDLLEAEKRGEPELDEREALERGKFRSNVRGRKKLKFAGYEFEAGGGRGTEIQREHVDVRKAGDYGADPLGNGLFRMVPSGDIVDFEERNRRLGTTYDSNAPADYYVWPLRHNEPLAGYGPYGPFDMMTAKTYARARSQEGTHDSAVTRGQDPQRFDIVRIYQAGTGERVYPPGSEGFEANED